MKSLLRSLSQLSSVSVALVRVLLGVIFVMSGYAKVFNMGFAVEAFRNAYHIPVSEFFGPLVSILELGGGVLLLVGLFTRYVGILYMIEFTVAAILVWSGKGMFPRTELLLLTGAFLLATHGAGTLSLDRPGQRWEL